jgi:hypothetical protein
MSKVQKVMRLIDQTQGRFFSVTFLKRETSEERTMLCRTGVRKFVTGTGLKFNPRERGLVSVWSADSQGYRFVPCESVTRLVINGQVYNFDMPQRLSTTDALRYSIEIAKAQKELR